MTHKTRTGRPLRALLIGAASVLALLMGLASSPGATGPQVPKGDITKMAASLSNWGRWGKGDQRGALNLITPAKRREASTLVKEGISISLAHNVLQTKAFDSPPFVHKMIQTGKTPGAQGALDEYSVNYHGYSQTHLDALCHIFFEGKLYNGFSQQVVTDQGCTRLAVTEMRNGVFTRGVLIDVPRLLGEKYLGAKRAIYPADLERWERRTGVRIEPGDAVLIRTGRWARYEAEGEWDPDSGSAGLDVSCMPWFKKRDVAVLGSDLALDKLPSGVKGVITPVHVITINAMGVPILDNLDLEAVSAALTAHKRSSFLLTVEPLAVKGGTGSPVNPVATF